MKDKQRGRRHRWGKQVYHTTGLDRRNYPTEHLEIHGQGDGDQDWPEYSSASMFVIGWEKPGQNLASS